ncbi:MAG: hypothetical protein KAU16_05130 [Methanophagales archaeon]|nr:hypothetical protein [Methanophagales archaeon]
MRKRGQLIGRIPHKVRGKIGISPHDRLVIGIKENNDSIILKKQKSNVSVFDLQLQPDEVAKGTLKEH